MDLFILCVEIFFARICDVSLGTFKTFMIVKGRKLLSALIGFLEVTIWFLVVRNALNSDSNSIFIVFAYAGGFAVGTYVGGLLAQKFLREKLGIRITITKSQSELVDILRKNGYIVSTMNAKGYKNNSKLMIFMEIDDKELPDVEKIVKEYDPNIFMVVSETIYVQNGHYKDIVK
ncbi:MAG: DUF2179 domain-containing protein [Bacilli bacterium]|nr:DUF2179 domain-containing protein [Bacilli bacterium]